MKKYFTLLKIAVAVSVTATAQNVGIGTTTPVSKLTVQTPLNTTGYTHIGGADEIIVDEAIGGVSASLGTMTNHTFRLKTNGVSRFHVLPDGQVVVGTNNTQPFGMFTVESATSNYGISHTDGNILLSTYVGGAANAGYFGTQSNHPLSFYTNNSASQVILLPNGNFGIGTTSPGTKLEVDGSIRVQNNGEFFGNIAIGTFASAGTGLNILKDLEAIRVSGNQSFISFYNGANYKGYLWNKGTDDMELGTAGVNTNGKLFLSIKGTSYLTLHSDGRVAVNGPPGTFIGLNGNRALTVTNTVILKDGTNNFNEWAITSNFEDLSFRFNGFSKAYIDVNGDYNSLSDISLKDGVLPYQPVLTKIKNLNVSTYHYKSNAAGKKSFGLIAQNVAEYFPEIVSETQDKDGRKLLAIAYAKTGVLAIKAIQEEQEIIEQQQSKIESLEKRLSVLEKMLLKN